MTKFKSIIAAIALNLPALVAAANAEAPNRLEISFTGMEAQKGNIMVALFDSEQSYGGGKPVRASMIAADKAEAKAVFEGLPAGRYAVKSFHDVDGNGQMDTNPFGMPIEPFAFSNNAHGAMGPATWADAAFDVKGGTSTQSITIK